MMKQADVQLIEMRTDRWNRRILNVYWLVVVLSLVIESVNLLFTLRDAKEFIIDYIVLPTVLLVVIVGLTELARHFSRRATDYIMLLSATLMASVLIAVHSTVNEIWSALYLPLLVSIFYFNPRKVVFAFGTSLLAYLLLSTFDPYLRAQTTLMDAFTMVAMLIGSLLIALGIMRRGVEIMENLRQTIEAQQELMVRTALMEKLTKTDALTGLNNHMSYHEYLGELIGQVEQYDLPLHEAILDIDNFKKVNDTYGHRVGDQVLEYVSRQIKAGVTGDDFVARYGGEEFVILFVDQSQEHVLQKMEQIRREIAQTPHEALDGSSVTISIGLNSYRKGLGKEALFVGADEALYKAKRAGKNRVVVWEH